MVGLIFSPNTIYAACVSNPAGVFSGAPSGPPQNFGDFICIVTNITSSLFPVLVGATVVVFFWGLVKFIQAGGSEDAQKEGKNLMLWGAVGIFVAVSIWGIVQVLSNSIFGSGPIGLPQLPDTNP